jgi:nucleoside-diphosphate-sugar epimerase
VRIIVTGAAGRLGRHVVARTLQAGHGVIAVDLPAVVPAATADVEWRAADLTELDQVRAALSGADAVVHLGALTSPRHPEPEVYRTNVGGTYNVLVAAEEHGLRAVCVASSVNAIGGIYSADPRYDYFPVDEEHPSYCEDSYSLSKWLVEQQMAAFARRRQHVPFSALRLHALREDITAARTAADDDDQRERLHLWGWTSFDSAAAACLLALHRPASGHGVYNIVGTRTASSTTSEELARRWYPKVPLRAPLPGDAGFYSTVKALAELGWDAHDEHPTVAAGERPSA